jgi:hypothetical protein
MSPCADEARLRDAPRDRVGHDRLGFAERGARAVGRAEDRVQGHELQPQIQRRVR